MYAEEEINEAYDIEDEEEGTVVVASAVNSPVIDEERIRYEIEQRVRREMEEELLRKEREAEELRQRLEEKLRAEVREKELLAEAAKAAVLEQQRLEKERLERERIEAAEREAAERRAEEERREKLRLEEERARAEAEAKAAAEAEARAKEEARKKSDDGYVSKKVKLIFKRPIDQSITTRIHDIIVATIRYYHKEDVYIKSRRTFPTSTPSTLNL